MTHGVGASVFDLLSGFSAPIVHRMTIVLQDHYPLTPEEIRLGHRLPGMRPLLEGSFILVDEAYGGQMALRRGLLETRRAEVLATQSCAQGAAAELLATVLAHLAYHPGFLREGDRMRCPDGQWVDLDADAPLLTLGRLLQEDLAILQKQGEAHVLTAAVLCFPASWMLSEKIGKPLIGIHTPVAEYDAAMAKRVQRLFDLIRIEQPMWRHNALFYATPELFHPRSEQDARRDTGPDQPYFRSEKQCLVRLPESGAVVFSIHTWLMAREKLTAAQMAALLGVGNT